MTCCSVLAIDHQLFCFDLHPCPPPSATNPCRLREKYIALYSDNHDMKKKAKEHKEKIKQLTTKNHKYVPSPAVPPSSLPGARFG